MREITGRGRGGASLRAGSGTTGRVLVGLLLLATLAGCGDAETGAGPDASPGAEASTAVESAAYLETPEGVTLTEPGSELALGESATIAWEPREGATAVLDLTVDRIERTTFDASFQGWQIDAATAAMTPYFVRASATNVSGEDLGGVAVLLWGRDDAGTLVDRQRFTDQTFRPCPSGDLPAPFADGASTTLCFVYLIAPGRTLDAVAFPPPAGLDPVLWRGKVSTKVQPPEPTSGPDARRKGGGAKKAGNAENQ